MGWSLCDKCVVWWFVVSYYNRKNYLHSTSHWYITFFCNWGPFAKANSIIPAASTFHLAQFGKINLSKVKLGCQSIKTLKNFPSSYLLKLKHSTSVLSLWWSQYCWGTLYSETPINLINFVLTLYILCTYHWKDTRPTYISAG